MTSLGEFLLGLVVMGGVVFGLDQLAPGWNDLAVLFIGIGAALIALRVADFAVGRLVRQRT